MKAPSWARAPHPQPVARLAWRHRLQIQGSGDRALLWLTAWMLVCLAAAAVAMWFDAREIREVSVWAKPMKFMAATAVLALTTWWFARHLPGRIKDGRAYRALVATLIFTALFEVGYITLQGALGQASHYNTASALHGLMYTLMGMAALALTATQPWLAWLLWRHGDRSLAPAYRHGMLIGLVLCFVLGAGAGMLLGGLQPPAGHGLPVLGWSTAGGDLRVAHFIGIHAEQVLPFIGFLLTLLLGRTRPALAGVWLASAGWTALWAWTLLQALQGRPLVAL